MYAATSWLQCMLSTFLLVTVARASHPETVRGNRNWQTRVETTTSPSDENSKARAVKNSAAQNQVTALYIKESTLPFKDLGADDDEWEVVAKSELGYEVPCGERGRSESVRIVGGSHAHPGEFPWMASVQVGTLPRVRHVCGASVLSAQWAVTSGHCLKDVDLSTVTVVVGDHDLAKFEGREQRRHLASVVIRSDIDVKHFKNDIALLQLTPPLNLMRGSVSPICLPLVTHTYSTGEGIVTGWGRLTEGGSHDHVLHYVELPIIPLSHCHKVYTDLGFQEYLFDNQLCLGLDDGSKDTCQGDSGGPLACLRGDGRYYLCGLVSWGYGCGRPNIPGIYTAMTPYSTWIQSFLYNRNNTVRR